MAIRKSGLGKGLDSLIPPSKSVNKSGEKVKEEKTVLQEEQNKSEKNPNIESGELKLKISLVEPNREQPRKQFDEDSLVELSESIKQYGILQPLIVSNKGDYYEIIAGERRWRAAKLAGLKEVPVIIKKYNDREVVEISLIENIQRENLNPIEEAQAYKRLMDEFHLKQDEIAERVSKSRTAVTNSMRLLKLAPKVQEMLVDEMLSAGHARTILGIEDPDMQILVANRVFDEKLSVRETEKLVKTMLNPKQKKEPVPSTAEDTAYEQLEEKLKGWLGTKVSIARKKNNKGKIEIEYYSQEELERLIDLLGSIS